MSASMRGRPGVGPRQLLVLGLVGIGCLPIPHREYDSPELTGVLERSGKAAAGVTVRVDTSTGGSPLCVEPRASGRTDSSGRFHLDRQGGWTPFFIYGDRMSTWTVCFEFPDGAQAHWTGHGWFGGPPLQRLSCRLEPTSKVNAVELATSPAGSDAPNSCTLLEPKDSSSL